MAKKRVPDGDTLCCYRCGAIEVAAIRSRRQRDGLPHAHPFCRQRHLPHIRRFGFCPPGRRQRLQRGLVETRTAAGAAFQRRQYAPLPRLDKQAEPARRLPRHLLRPRPPRQEHLTLCRNKPQRLPSLRTAAVAVFRVLPSVYISESFL